MQRQSFFGFTLVEYLIALSISLIISLSAYSLLQGFLTREQQTDQAWDAFEQRIIVARQLRHAVRMAGFSGCIRPQNLPPPIVITEEGSVMTLWYAEELNSNVILKPNDVLLLNNCICVELRTIQTVTPQKIILERPWHCAFSKTTLLYRIVKEKYFLDIDRRTQQKGLFLQKGQDKKILLIAPIKDFKIQYEKTGVSIYMNFENSSKEWTLFVSPRNR